jgi:hypothetical protein
MIERRLEVNALITFILFFHSLYYAVALRSERWESASTSTIK